jgi:hypothetical protein
LSPPRKEEDEENIMVENGKKRYLTAEQILEMDDLNTMDVEVPEWPIDGEPGLVRLKTLSAREALTFQKQMQVNAKAREDAMVSIVVLSAVDENGERLFNQKQVELLRDKSVKVFTRLQTAAMELNGFSNPSKDADVKNA